MGKIFGRNRDLRQLLSAEIVSLGALSVLMVFLLRLPKPFLQKNLVQISAETEMLPLSVDLSVLISQIYLLVLSLYLDLADLKGANPLPKILLSSLFESVQNLTPRARARTIRAARKSVGGKPQNQRYPARHD